ncbi:hypothetical protein P12x_003590 [Tundrisphaera lichenicola]|uniref:hypothetical protein n=1 Tax=Tundrisphaera lichenicola TaxID=2029860 RepID=UPI003EBCE5B1
MRKSIVIRSLGVILAASLALTMGNRPPIQASPPAQFGGVDVESHEEAIHEPARVIHLEARPMSPEAARIWLKLQLKLDMVFPDETSLDDVVKHIQKSTVSEPDFPDGIPIYVDPQGLQDADKTMASTVSINLKEIPLATTFSLLLKQLGLVYRIHKDGMIFVTSTSSEDATQAETEIMILDTLNALNSEVRALRGEIRSLRAGAPENFPAPPSAANDLKGGMGGMGGMM